MLAGQELFGFGQESALPAELLELRRLGSLQPQNGSPLNHPVALLHGINPVHCRNPNLFFPSAGPNDFDAVHLVSSTQTKMQALVGTGSVTSSAKNIAALTETACRNKHLGADSITWTFLSAYEFECHPVICILNHISQQHRRAIDVVHHYVDMSIIEEIAKRRSPSGQYQPQTASCRSGYLSELVPVEIAE